MQTHQKCSYLANVKHGWDTGTQKQCLGQAPQLLYDAGTQLRLVLQLKRAALVLPLEIRHACVLAGGVWKP